MGHRFEHARRRGRCRGPGLALLCGAALLVATPARAQEPPHAGAPGSSPTARVGASRSAHDTSAAVDARDPITAATREYQASGIARTLVQGNFSSFPYGHAQPTLTCTVLRACVIELEAGEVVLSRISGDTERWEIGPAPAGPDGRTVLIVVKPRDCDITTNLVLATDRRLYDLTLDSPPCRGRSTNPQQPYVRHVRFYYPDETIARWAKPPAPAAPVGPAGPAPQRVAADVLALNFAYRVKKDRQFPWKPAQVFDDGVRVYIKVPLEARHAEAPVLFVLEADGSKVLVNYSIVGGDTYVTDRLFDRAVLLSGVGGKERQVLIERADWVADGDRPGLPPSPFGAH